MYVYSRCSVLRLVKLRVFARYSIVLHQSVLDVALDGQRSFLSFLVAHFFSIIFSATAGSSILGWFPLLSVFHQIIACPILSPFTQAVRCEATIWPRAWHSLRAHGLRAWRKCNISSFGFGFTMVGIWVRLSLKWRFLVSSIRVLWYF